MAAKQEAQMEFHNLKRSTSLPTISPSQLVGRYEHPSYGVFVVAQDGTSDRLTGAVEVGGAFPFTHYGYNTYLLEWNYTLVANVPFTFVTDELNRVIACK
jgi:hypothetical protein